MISYDAFGLDKDLVDHGVTVTTVHLVDAVLVEFGQRQQHPQGQSLGLLTVAQLHRLSSSNADPCRNRYSASVFVTVKVTLPIVS